MQPAGYFFIIQLSNSRAKTSVRCWTHPRTYSTLYTYSLAGTVLSAPAWEMHRRLSWTEKNAENGL